MGASHSVEATDTKIVEEVEAPVAEPESEEEEIDPEQGMDWFWPFI